MTFPSKPTIQQVVPKIQDRIQQPERNGAVRNLASIASGVFEIGQAFRQIAWMRILQTEALNLRTQISFATVPFGDAWRVHAVGAANSLSPSVRCGVFVSYPAQGGAGGAPVIQMATAFALEHTVQTADVLNGRSNTSETFLNKPFLEIFPPGRLLIVTDPTGAGAAEIYDFIIELVDGPLKAQQDLLGNPVVSTV